MVTSVRSPRPAASISVGLELEFAVAASQDVARFDARPVFGRLNRLWTAQQRRVESVVVDHQLVSLESDAGVFSVDNGFNNLEYAFAPVGAQFGHGNDAGLNHLATIVHQEVNGLITALDHEGAMVLNLAEHPATAIDAETYRALRAPKTIYGHWVGDRGWRHDQGIDAKAQNGPTTGVPVRDAVSALNLSLLAAPAMIALFGNSPFEAGQVTGLLENRLTLWPRMFADASFDWDRRCHLPPHRPFADLADYFRWMYGPGTAMHALPAPAGTYKGYSPMLRVQGDPPMLEFLAGPARAVCLPGHTHPVLVTPDFLHLAQQQFTHFLDARIRFCLADAPALAPFLACMNGQGSVEALFEQHGIEVYIEGRACGANFPDQALCDLGDAMIPSSVVMAPSALQKGLLANPDSWTRLSALVDWAELPWLRDAAIRHGLHASEAGARLQALTARVLEEAQQGLAPDERWMLAYPEHVLRRAENGAQRALARYQSLSGSAGERLQRLSAERRALPLPSLATVALPDLRAANLA